jgi:hypothetical protein
MFRLTPVVFSTNQLSSQKSRLFTNVKIISELFAAQPKKISKEVTGDTKKRAWLNTDLNWRLRACFQTVLLCQTLY